MTAAEIAVHKYTGALLLLEEAKDAEFAEESLPKYEDADYDTDFSNLYGLAAIRANRERDANIALSEWVFEFLGAKRKEQ